MKRLFLENKIKIIGITLCMAFFFLMCLVTTRLFKKEDALTRKPRIVLVNEDVSSELNGKHYHFGKNFIDSVSQDKEYSWQLLPRAMADKLYDEGEIDAIIYLPHHFSKNILTLQDLVPTQAVVDIKIKKQPDELFNQLLKRKIDYLLYDSNKKIIKMYYATIVNHLAQVEGYLNGILGRDEHLVTLLEKDVTALFQEMEPQYDSLFQKADYLQSLNASNVVAQNVFTENTVSSLQMIDQQLTDQLPVISDYLLLQNSIANVNVENANVALVQQAREHNTRYMEQFSDFYNALKSELLPFSSLSNNRFEQEELFTLLQNKVATYHQVLTETSKAFTQKVQLLTEQREQLLDLEKKLYRTFFSQIIAPTFEKFDYKQLITKENAKIALSNYITHAFDRKNHVSQSGLLDKLKQLISQISVDLKEYPFDTLEKYHFISHEKRKDYEQKLKLIQQYATAFSLQSGTLKSIDLTPKDSSKSAFSQLVSIQVPAQTTYVSNPIPSDFSFTSRSNDLLSDDRTITLLNQTNHSQMHTFSLLFSLDYVVEKNWQLTFTHSKNNEKVIAIAQKLIGSNDSKNTYTYQTDQFESIYRLLNGIDTTVNTILLLYGAPNEEVTDLLAASSKELFEQHAHDSVVSLYGNLIGDNLLDYLNEQDVQLFFNNGQQTVLKVQESIVKLNDAISQLTLTVDNLSKTLPIDYFSEQLEQLFEWYKQVMNLLEEKYANIRTVQETQLPILEWSQYQNGESALYIDNSHTLHERLTTMLQTVSQTLQQTEENAQSVTNHSELFDALLDATMVMQSQAETLLLNTEALTKKGVDNLKKNRLATEQFSTIFSNTRRKDVDKENLYNFLSNPIISQDLAVDSPNKVILSSQAPFINSLLLGLLLGITISLGGIYFKKTVLGKKSPNRTFRQ